MVQTQTAADGNDAGVSLMAADGEALIAGTDALEAFCRLPAQQRPPLDAALRGVLAETALTGRQRYEWRLLAPLLHSLLDSLLADYTRQEEEAGPPRPPPPGFDSLEDLSAGLHKLIDGHEAAPFTLQRLCEVLLEPRKQYARLDKVALAIEKLLMVTSTRQPDEELPPLPPLATLQGVNENPPSPYLDGRPPQVLDRQQQQALQQQQVQAMVSAQQGGRQQLGGGGLPNGLDDGPPPLEPADGAEPGPAAAGAAAAAAAAEAMQLDLPASVSAALQPAAAAAAAAAGEQQAAAEGPPAITAAEVASAASFVESALAMDPSSPAPPTGLTGSGGGGGSGGPQSPAAAAAGEGASEQVPPTPLDSKQQQQQPGPSPTGQEANGVATPLSPAAAAAEAATCPTPMEAEATGASSAPGPAQMQQQGEQQMPVAGQQQPSGAAGGHPAAAPSSSGVGGNLPAGQAEALQQVVLSLQQHLSPQLQQLLATLLPPQPSSQQQLPRVAAADSGVAAATAAGMQHAALSRLMLSVLPQLPPDKAELVLSGLQPLLPASLLEQLQQQQQPQ